MRQITLYYIAPSVVVFIIVTLFSCNSANQRNTEKWKKEILETEKEFALMSRTKGIPAAFMAFADDSAVLLRNNSLYIGKDALREYYSHSSNDTNVDLAWKPQFIDVSESGDMAYTYGYYTYSFLDSTQNKVETKGVFHTIWKRQSDGSWKFVWD